MDGAKIVKNHAIQGAKVSKQQQKNYALILIK